jgi:hypothetical protein
MAFNFNWSPLTADAGFYERARDLLTTALNKSPKPPIIVDDIFVTEFNLGSVPPDLEILEIGDLAEDRFRGIFKMCYSGDAFLTLKTRVQVCGNFFLSLNRAPGRWSWGRWTPPVIRRRSSMPACAIWAKGHIFYPPVLAVKAFKSRALFFDKTFACCFPWGAGSWLWVLESREGAARGLGALS